MGLFSAISSFVSGVCSFVGRICSGIAGALGGLGSAISGFVSKIGLALPGLDILSAILMVVNVVSTIAEVLGLKEKDKDNPDELAMKAEKDGSGPEKYKTTEEYVKHLQNDVKLSKEEKERLANMSDEERAAYRATGSYLYAKACSEKLGLDNTGLKNPELVGLTAEVLTDLAKIQGGFAISEFPTYCKHLKAEGLDLKDFSNYLHNCSTDLEKDQKVESALISAMKEIKLDITQEQINNKLYALNIED